MSEKVLGLLDGLARWVWPGHCAVCGELLAPDDVAPFSKDCDDLVGCGRFDLRDVDFCWAAWAYENGIRSAVSRWKYGKTPAIGRGLNGRLWRLVAERERAHLPAVLDRVERLVLAPVPPSKTRLRTRGFDPVMGVARALRRGLRVRRPELEVRVEARLLRRIRDTPAQASLEREERLDNVAGAFVSRPIPAGWLVCVVDDVATTGATARAAADALRAAGTTRVGFLAMARADREIDGRAQAVGAGAEAPARLGVARNGARGRGSWRHHERHDRNRLESIDFEPRG